MEYHISNNAAAAVTHYTLVAGNDSAERDPASWRVEGRLSVGSAWLLLDVSWTLTITLTLTLTQTLTLANLSPNPNPNLS